MKRLVGLLVFLIALPSLILTLYILVQVWRLQQPITVSLLSGVDVFAAALDSASDGLTTMQQSLDTTTANIDQLENTSQSLTQSLHDTGPLMNSLTTLTGKDLPTTITATQQSLNSAEGTALLVDDTLSALARVPFLPITPYQPQVPLHTAIAQVSTSLDNLSPSLLSIDKSLLTTSGNLATIETQTREMSQSMDKIKMNLVDIKQTVGQYRASVAKLRVQVTELRVAIPGWVMIATWLSLFILGWLALVQVEWLVEGVQMLR
jgi:chromosome segregation ATPase